ncbi:MAG: hypothetical protein JSV88_00810 [Candidatus Aminicenantes bacterium]|nr:MAG: hypothetical protein JSV88_00810 [Candidatus Aminicenantes bacterium]
MINPQYPPCPYCGSENVLPFEEEEKSQSDPTLFIVIVLAVSLIVGYFLFMLSSYLTFPLIVFVAIIISTKLINKQDREKKPEKPVEKDYMCLDCSGFFRK